MDHTFLEMEKGFVLDCAEKMDFERVDCKVHSSELSSRSPLLFEQRVGRLLCQHLQVQ